MFVCLFVFTGFESSGNSKDFSIKTQSESLFWNREISQHIGHCSFRYLPWCWDSEAGRPVLCLRGTFVVKARSWILSRGAGPQGSTPSTPTLTPPPVIPCAHSQTLSLCSAPLGLLGRRSSAWESSLHCYLNTFHQQGFISRVSLSCGAQEPWGSRKGLG